MATQSAVSPFESLRFTLAPRSISNCANFIFPTATDLCKSGWATRCTGPRFDPFEWRNNSEEAGRRWLGRNEGSEMQEMNSSSLLVMRAWNAAWSILNEKEGFWGWMDFWNLEEWELLFETFGDFFKKNWCKKIIWLINKFIGWLIWKKNNVCFGFAFARLRVRGFFYVVACLELFFPAKSFVFCLLSLSKTWFLDFIYFWWEIVDWVEFTEL